MEGNAKPIFKEMYMHPDIRLVVWFGFGVTALIFFVYLVAFSRTGWPVADTESWGLFGDFVGGVATAVLGLLSLYLILATVYFTFRAMELAKANLTATKQELGETKKEMRRQSFDGKVFFLLKVFLDVRSDLEYQGSRAGHRSLGSAFSNVIQQVLGNTHESTEKPQLVKIVRSFASELTASAYIVPYFTSLTALLDLIDELSVGDDELGKSAIKYKRMLSSVLTDYELVVLFLYSQNPEVSPFEREVIESYLFTHVVYTRQGMLRTALPNIRNTLKG